MIHREGLQRAGGCRVQASFSFAVGEAFWPRCDASPWAWVAGITRCWHADCALSSATPTSGGTRPPDPLALDVLSDALGFLRLQGKVLCWSDLSLEGSESGSRNRLRDRRIGARNGSRSGSKTRPKIRSRIGRMVGPFAGRKAGRIRGGRPQAFRALTPLPTPSRMQHGQYPSVSRPRPRNDEMRAWTGNLGVQPRHG